MFLFFSYTCIFEIPGTAEVQLAFFGLLVADDSNYCLRVWWFKKESCVAIKVREKHHPRENSSCGKLMKQEKYQPNLY